MVRVHSLPLSRIFLLVAVFCTLFATESPANENNTHDNLSIEVNASKIKNIIKQSNRSLATIRIGGLKQSNSSRQVQINIKLDHVNNQINAGSNNRSRINLGNIENSTVSKTDIEIDLRTAKNTLRGGTNNHAVINVGAIQNSVMSGRVSIQIKSRFDIENIIRNGSGKRSEISIGSITNDNENNTDNDSSNDIFEQYQPQLFPVYILQSQVVTPQIALIKSINTRLKSTAVASPAVAPSRTNAESSDQEQYTIEKRQSSIGNVGGHNFLVLRDSKRNVVSEIHGLSVNLETGDSSGKLRGGKRGLRVITFDRSKGENSGRIENKQPSTILLTGSKAQAMKLWQRARKKGDEIDELELPYPKLGVKLFRRTVNSNSVESTLSAAMGLESPKLKLPLAIQDYEHAYEYDIKPEQNFLYTPGEGRLIPTR